MSTQSDIRDYLKPLCQWVFVTTAGRLPGARKYHLAPAGFPDIMAMTLEGKAVFIEVKRAKEAFRPKQKEFIDWHKDRGYIAFVARSLDDVKREMKCIKH